MQVENPKISVITVVYNNVAGIQSTLDSFFLQTWENKEIVVIDGGSTDGTVDAGCFQFVEKDTEK